RMIERPGLHESSGNEHLLVAGRPIEPDQLRPPVRTVVPVPLEHGEAGASDAKGDPYTRVDRAHERAIRAEEGLAPFDRTGFRRLGLRAVQQLAGDQDLPLRPD